MNTIMLTDNAQSSDQWLSVQVAAGAPIGSVAVYNREDGDPYQSWLSPYEIWLGASAGAQTYSCSRGPITLPTGFGMGPFTTSCDGRSDLPFVTLVLRSGTFRYLAIGEVKVYR